MKQQWDNMLIIAGTTSNVGKTTLVCDLIKKLSGNNNMVTAIKISSGFNSACKLCVSVLKDGEYIILEEKQPGSDTDSGRMLAAGAEKVLHIQAEGKGLVNCFEKLSSFLSHDTPIIVESGSLYELVNPGCLVLLSNEEPIVKNKHLVEVADIHIKSGAKPDIEFGNGKWYIQK